MKKNIAKPTSLLLIAFWAFIGCWGITSFPTNVFAQAPFSLNRSVLSEGKWVKITIEQTGIYTLSYEDLKKMGFSEPEKVGVYGYGGALLSEKLSEAPPTDLPAMPVYHHNKAIYFYGKGPLHWYYDTRSKAYKHVINHYSTKGYLFLSDIATPGVQHMQEAQLAANGAPSEAKYYDALQLHEQDIYTLKQSGRMLFGEPLINGQIRRIAIDLGTAPRVDNSLSINYAYTALPKAEGRGALSLGINGNVFASDIINLSEDYSYSSYISGIYHQRYGAKTEVEGRRFDLEVTYQPSGDPAYLDYIEIQSARALRYQQGEQMHIRKWEPDDKNLLFKIEDLGNEGIVFAINSKGIPSMVKTEQSGMAHTFTSNALTAQGQPQEFIALRPQDALKPLQYQSVNNQNIKGAETPKLIIISTKEFRSEAERLATYHREKEDLVVLVVEQEEVFNEFSSGTPDATAYRLMAKHFYERWKEEHQGEEYCPIQLLLFGDGAADNRKISAEWKLPAYLNTEFLLSYQSVNSLNIQTYTNDDYFGLLRTEDDAETNGKKELSIGIGRFPVRTLAEAKAAVDKTIAYSENKDPGVWKTRATFVADNADYPGVYSHLNHADELAHLALRLQPELILNKIYLDAHAQKTENGLNTFPTAKRQLHDALENGTLFINYVGHGSPTAWTNEQIMTLSDIQQFKYKHLPVWITATCDFCNFDNPQTSGGEMAFLNDKSGAIALFTTTRVVLDVDNQILNNLMLNSLLGKDQSGAPHKLGNILRNAKNQRGGNDTINKLNFMLIGNPALQLKLPTHRAIISTINGKSLDQTSEIAVKALEQVVVKGFIQDLSGSVDGNFSGKLYITVFDGEEEKSVHPDNIPPDSEKIKTYKDFTGVVYAGNATIEKGFFEFSFIVPKDVAYSAYKGKINLYAYAPDITKEAMGVDRTIRITEGSPNQPIIDTIPPVVELCYLNNPNQTDNFVVGPTPLLVAKVFDLNGINITGGGVGHDITLVIDNRFDLSYKLNNYYTASDTEAGKGDIVYMLPPLDEGDHTAVLTVWDVFNNVTRHSFKFRVNKDLPPSATATRLFPNPARRGNPITFELYTDNPGETLQAYIELFDFTGKRVSRSERVQVQAGVNAPIQLSWLPITSYGTVVAAGHYLYRWTILANNGKQTTSSGQMVIVDP